MQVLKSSEDTHTYVILFRTMMLNFVFIYFIYMYYIYGNLVSVQLKKGHTFKTEHGEYIE